MVYSNLADLIPLIDFVPGETATSWIGPGKPTERKRSFRINLLASSTSDFIVIEAGIGL